PDLLRRRRHPRLLRRPVLRRAARGGRRRGGRGTAHARRRHHGRGAGPALLHPRGEPLVRRAGLGSGEHDRLPGSGARPRAGDVLFGHRTGHRSRRRSGERRRRARDRRVRRVQAQYRAVQGTGPQGHRRGGRHRDLRALPPTLGRHAALRAALTATLAAVPTPLRLEVIVASVRPERFAPVVADWFLATVRERREFDTGVLDLREIALPADLTETPAVADFRARLGAADAFVAITSEYNHGYPASLKTAFDSAKHEWRAKPIGFVSYGGMSGGRRAVEQLRQVVAELHMVS